MMRGHRVARAPQASAGRICAQGDHEAGRAGAPEAPAYVTVGGAGRAAEDGRRGL